MLESTLSELASAARIRIQQAASPEVLETVRVDILGRKGSLTQISKEMGKLPAGERAAVG
jgi:phenylalanyl-tRNA synthetase alpha chain